MKTHEEVYNYKERMYRSVIQKCKKCNGMGNDCECAKKYNYIVTNFESCIPKKFWSIKKSDVVYNKKIFNKFVLNYIDKSTVALKHGYGLFFLGNNGSGKTFFINYILTRLIKKNRYVYYTTEPQLKYDFEQAKVNKDLMLRLKEMLNSDFIAIDDLGKDYEGSFKDKTGVSQIERIFKHRLDNCYPMLLASNKKLDELTKIYGESLASILDEGYNVVPLLSKDYRKKLRQKRNQRMGWDEIR